MTFEFLLIDLSQVRNNHGVMETLQFYSPKDTISPRVVVDRTEENLYLVRHDSVSTSESILRSARIQLRGAGVSLACIPGSSSRPTNKRSFSMSSTSGLHVAIWWAQLI